MRLLWCRMNNGKLKILLFGDFRFEWLLAPSFDRAFRAIGQAVIPFDSRAHYSYLDSWLRTRLGHKVSLQSLALRRRGSRSFNMAFLKHIERAKPDLIFILNGDFIMPETLRSVRKQGIRVFIFHADSPFPPSPNHRPEAIAAALECDCYLIWSRSLKKRLEDMGVRRARYFPFAWDEQIYPFQEQRNDSQFQYDLVFIGNWSGERERWLTSLAKHFRLFIWGEDYWKTRTRVGSPLKSCWQGKALMGKDACEVLNRTRIALNILNLQNMPEGLNMRSFELPGCGAFFMASRTQGGLEIFPENSAGAYFSSEDELKEKAEYYLKRDAERRQCIIRAHDIVKTSHTYHHRAHEIVKIYKESEPA